MPMEQSNEAPDIDEFAAMAEQALANLPPALRKHIKNVSFVVQEWPDDGVLKATHVESPRFLLGLYRGVPLIRRSVLHSGYMPDRIFLYRQPIIRYSLRHGTDIYNVIRNVVVHEIAHYFGFSDEDIRALESQPNVT